jgi:hypothetical protein
MDIGFSSQVSNHAGQLQNTTISPRTQVHLLYRGLDQVSADFSPS